MESTHHDAPYRITGYDDDEYKWIFKTEGGEVSFWMEDGNTDCEVLSAKDLHMPWSDIHEGDCFIHGIEVDIDCSMFLDIVVSGNI